MNSDSQSTAQEHHSSATSADSSCSIVVDLDGTLTPTDTLFESIVLLVKRLPVALILVPFWLFSGRASFKRKIAERAGIAAKDLPFHAELLAFLRSEKERGRKVFLATAADRTIALAVAAHLELFDDVIASDGILNMKGSAKLEAIRKCVGDRFTYIGDSKADLPIWRAADSAVLVGVPARTARTVRELTHVEREFFHERATFGIWLRALRVHQWLKNCLLFVPLLTAFSFLDVGSLAAALAGFISFSLAASATYLINDLWDLENDRAHPRKRSRALASARISIPSGVGAAICLLGLALLLASFLPLGFLGTLIAYLIMTSTYSLILKRHVMMDVIMLSLLYTLRIIAGSYAITVETSSWLLAFSVFIFISLALLKRCSELVSLELSGRDTAVGRDYFARDLVVLWPLGVGAAMCSVVVFGLFISAPETQIRYTSPKVLWLVAVALIYWLARLWIKTARGQMHDDPLMFSIRDRGTRVTLVGMVFVTLVAHYLKIG